MATAQTAMVGRLGWAWVLAACTGVVVGGCASNSASQHGDAGAETGTDAGVEAGVGGSDAAGADDVQPEAATSDSGALQYATSCADGGRVPATPAGQWSVADGPRVFAVPDSLLCLALRLHGSEQSRRSRPGRRHRNVRLRLRDRLTALTRVTSRGRGRGRGGVDRAKSANAAHVIGEIRRPCWTTRGRVLRGAG
jgi:hypothetical protein